MFDRKSGSPKFDTWPLILQQGLDAYRVTGVIMNLINPLC
jgi:hypothetical protein